MLNIKRPIDMLNLFYITNKCLVISCMQVDLKIFRYRHVDEGPQPGFNPILAFKVVNQWILVMLKSILREF